MQRIKYIKLYILSNIKAAILEDFSPKVKIPHIRTQTRNRTRTTIA